MMAKYVKHLAPFIFIAFSLMCFYVGASLIAYINAFMGIVQIIAGMAHISLPKPPKHSGGVLHVFAVLSPFLSSAMLLMIACTNASAAHDAQPDKGWFHPVWGQHQFIFGAFFLPIVHQVHHWGESQKGRKYLMEIEQKLGSDSFDDKHLIGVALIAGLCVVAVGGSMLSLLFLTGNAVLGKSVATLCSACSGWGVIVQKIQKAIESTVDDVSLASEAAVEQIKDAEASIENDFCETNWGQLGDSLAEPLLKVAS